MVEEKVYCRPREKHSQRQGTSGKIQSVHNSELSWAMWGEGEEKREVREEDSNQESKGIKRAGNQNGWII